MKGRSNKRLWSSTWGPWWDESWYNCWKSWWQWQEKVILSRPIMYWRFTVHIDKSTSTTLSGPSSKDDFPVMWLVSGWAGFDHILRLHGRDFNTPDHCVVFLSFVDYLGSHLNTPEASQWKKHAAPQKLSKALPAPQKRSKALPAVRFQKSALFSFSWEKGFGSWQGKEIAPVCYSLVCSLQWCIEAQPLS